MIRVRAEIVKRDLCRLHGGEVIKEEKGFDFPVIIISIGVQSSDTGGIFFEERM